MTRYGHELMFGSFVTPTATEPDQVVRLAQRAERAGLDLVTCQDHPYLPTQLDAWTLLSYLAAATSRIRLAPNVLNVRLRQPVVVARSAASLDLLTSGRVELGLGAGRYWQAIQAAGGRWLTPGQAVTATGEAIQIIREMWSVGTRGGVRVAGEHHRVAGVKRGPAPAHDISVWVGAYRPRMLRLIGQVADGWLPSLPELAGGMDDLAEANARIDDSAAAAGRDPRSVRRLLNLAGRFATASTGPLAGPPDQWAEELAGLAMEHGTSAFILMSDELPDVERFGLEVAPAVRELVAAEAAPPSA